MNRTERTAVVGAGAMGTGLAVQFALCGLDVTLIDHRQSNLDAARETIADVVEFLDERGIADAPTGTDDTPSDAVLDRTGFTLDLADGVAGTDLVLETVSEDLAIKREVFERAARATTDAVLATNTSSLQVTDVAEGAPGHGDRVVGCHWWYPPYLLCPVEVVAGEETSTETLRRTQAFVERVDRDPVVVRRDVPGFVWNRIQFAVLRECVHIVEAGVASVEDVNRAVRDGYARRTAVVGPFETVDIAGLELFETIAEGLYPHLCDDDEPGELFADHVDRGRGGVEDGAGFLEYDEPAEAVTRRRDERLATLRRVLDAEE
ncbi:3-hydroxyacyl-CoA dehydrogenase [Halobacteriales archaeon QS_8_69_26]|nr:MAG: 3-hydroxyacyl-CoA dehydrogenase [Halobacteriales archaeon QS_8_69_26]